jgi:adenosylhomocysteinase
MDMSFSIQAMCLKHIAINSKSMNNVVYTVPEIIDDIVAKMKLDSMEIQIDTLTDLQKDYLESW